MSCDDQVPADVMDLITIATFNGLCRIFAALARNGALAPFQLDDIENCMTAPLDDPDWRDNESMAAVREVLVKVLARAMIDARGLGGLQIDAG